MCFVVGNSSTFVRTRYNVHLEVVLLSKYLWLRVTGSPSQPGVSWRMDGQGKLGLGNCFVVLCVGVHVYAVQRCLCLHRNWGLFIYLKLFVSLCFNCRGLLNPICDLVCVGCPGVRVV